MGSESIEENQVAQRNKNQSCGMWCTDLWEGLCIGLFFVPFRFALVEISYLGIYLEFSKSMAN